MVRSTAHGGVLYSYLVENAAPTALVLMTELSLDDICDTLILSVRMQRPDSTRTQSIIVQHAEVSETIVQRTIVHIEREMPPTTKRPILNPTRSLIESVSNPDRYLDVFCFLRRQGNNRKLPLPALIFRISIITEEMGC